MIGRDREPYADGTICRRKKCATAEYLCATRSNGWMIKNQFVISRSGKTTRGGNSRTHVVPHARVLPPVNRRNRHHRPRAIGAVTVYDLDRHRCVRQTVRTLSFGRVSNCGDTLDGGLGLGIHCCTAATQALGADIVQCSRGCNVWPRYVNGVMLWRSTGYSADQPALNRQRTTRRTPRPPPGRLPRRCCRMCRIRTRFRSGWFRGIER